MTRAELTEWLTYHFKLFPQQRADLRKAVAADVDRTEYMDIWYDEVFSSISLEDAKSASRELLRDPPDYFRAERLPGVIRQICERQSMAGNRHMSEWRREGGRQKVKSAPRETAGLYQRITAAVAKWVKQGKSKAESLELATGEVFPAAADEFEDPRDAVRCRICGDVGSVECFGVRAMARARQVARNKLFLGDIGPLHSAWVQCSCGEGKAEWVTSAGKRFTTKALPRFDPALWVPVSEGTDSLLEWARNYVQAGTYDFGEYSG